MLIPTRPPQPFAPLFSTDRARLLDLLGALDATDWARSTPCPGWTVLGLAAHLLGDDLFLLASQRDGHVGTVPPAGTGEAGLAKWLDEVQAEWVHAARRLSPRLVVDLLGWTTGPIADLLGHQDATAVDARVSWASDEPVPRWLDQARELSERWIHRQQLLEALSLPSDLRGDLAAPVLDALRWAFPFRLATLDRPAGAAVTVDVTGPEVAVSWSLVSDGRQWAFGPPADGQRLAALRLTTDQAWRLLTNNLSPAGHGEGDAAGDAGVLATLRHTRAIIGIPHWRPT